MRMRKVVDGEVMLLCLMPVKDDMTIEKRSVAKDELRVQYVLIWLRQKWSSFTERKVC